MYYNYTFIIYIFKHFILKFILSGILRGRITFNILVRITSRKTKFARNQMY